jgi:uncharacterized protein YdiU (UPF0061 family)
MAGLLMKELIARGDLQRCLVVCPGSLAEQWQDELYRRFNLPFEILTNDKLEAARTGNWFMEANLVIARLDKLARNEDVQQKLQAPDCRWDLVVCDEAHKLSATFFGGEVKYTKRYRLAQLLSSLTRHFLLMTATPHNGKEEDFQLFMALLAGVAERQASLIAQWMQVGFIHGVMNTDNMTISGETIDFGPCAFMDAYDPATVFSAIDDYGRYAYANQPKIAQWNLARLAEALLPQIDSDQQRAIDLATEVIVGFQARYEAHWLAGMRAKLGLTTSDEGDAALVESFLDALHGGGADFTLGFRRLGEAARGAPHDAALRSLFANPEKLDAWLPRWRERLAREPLAPAERAAAMARINPLVIARNHRVEQAIAAAVEHDDFAPFESLLQAVERPFDDDPGMAAYAQPPLPAERVCRTFCGT